MNTFPIVSLATPYRDPSESVSTNALTPACTDATETASNHAPTTTTDHSNDGTPAMLLMTLAKQKMAGRKHGQSVLSGRLWE